MAVRPRPIGPTVMCLGSAIPRSRFILSARFVNVDAAMQVARINLIDWHNIGQQPFARLARSRQVDDAVIARCQTWIAEHYHERSPVSAMVRLSGRAERSFKR